MNDPDMNSAGSSVDVQFAVSAEGVPSETLLREWTLQALPADRKDAEITIRVVDEAEITALNREYRGKDGATNVLSFPYESMPAIETALLGDVVICAPVVAMESVAQQKPLEAHWAHMVVHGVLHLLGYDHQKDSEARDMEEHETQLLARLGYANPY
jgi:probable rRNA maturation factor